MIELTLTDVSTFFAVSAVCLAMIVLWIINSETKRNACKSEMSKLRNQLESSEREKFILAEKLAEAKDSSFINAVDGPSSGGDEIKDAIIQELKRSNSNLESENNRLRSELEESKSSLEEVYKAMCK